MLRIRQPPDRFELVKKSQMTVVYCISLEFPGSPVVLLLLMKTESRYRIDDRLRPGNCSFHKSLPPGTVLEYD